MEYHLDYRVTLSEKSDFKSLYGWSLQEIDEDGEKHGRDYIPWNWTIYFTATKFIYSHSASLGSRYGKKDGDEEATQFAESEFIRADLRPGAYHEDPRWAAQFSMLGTKRTITTIGLYISPISEPHEPETCRVWGGLSYTANSGFRDDTGEDTLQIYMVVTPERFSRYAARVKAGDFDFATVALNNVKGLYSEWTPDIVTNKFKVLTKLIDHKVEIATDATIQPPELGKVEHSELAFYTERKVRSVNPTVTDAEDVEPYDDPAIEISTPDALTVLSPKLEQGFKRLQTAMWIVAALLFLLLIK